ncbi:MAG TPA: RsmD family RNA methyltransferase, partial [Lacipirellulaceae bacterium]|nr:RsmD family RNA methyltransferase [Lacipirellulaceae bacterium]
DSLLVTRPMKHRLRETIFNLVGVEAAGTQAIDLFAGTGALGLEALSRGAAQATFIERHVPTARVIEENIATLGAASRCTLLMTSAFLWAKRDLGPTPTASSPPSDRPWLTFCSPPYDFYVDRVDEMLELIAAIQQAAPAHSILVVESDERFDFSRLTTVGTDGRDIRSYPPAVLGIWRKGGAA